MIPVPGERPASKSGAPSSALHKGLVAGSGEPVCLWDAAQHGASSPPTLPPTFDDLKEKEGNGGARPECPCPPEPGGGSLLTPEGHEDREEHRGGVVEEVAGPGRGARRAHLPVAAGLVAQRAHGDIVPLVTHLHAGREGTGCQSPGRAPAHAEIRYSKAIGRVSRKLQECRLAQTGSGDDETLPRPLTEERVQRRDGTCFGPHRSAGTGSRSLSVEPVPRPALASCSRVLL